MSPFIAFLVFMLIVIIILSALLFAVVREQNATLLRISAARDPIGERRFLELVRVLELNELPTPERHWLITALYPEGKLFLDDVGRPIPIPAPNPPPAPPISVQSDDD